MARPRLVSTLKLPDGGFARGTRGVAGFAEDALREVERGADELSLVEPPGLDRHVFLAALERTAAVVRVPVVALAPVGAVDEVRALLEAGADRICPGRAIVATPSLLEACAARTGAARLLAELPVRRRAVPEGPAPRTPAWARGREDLLAEPGGFEVLDARGSGTGLSVLAWAVEAVRRGAGELLVSCVPWPWDAGPIRALVRAVRVPVAARAGEAAAAEVRLLLEAGADAVHLPATGEDPRLVRRALAADGVPA